MKAKLENTATVSERETSEVAEVATSFEHGESDAFAGMQSILWDTEFEARLEARIQEEVERRFQSAKDKRWAQLEKQYGQLSQMSREADPAPTERAESPGDPALTPGDPALTMGDPALAQARRLLEKAELTRDAEALELVRNYRGGSEASGMQLLADVAELALRRLNRAPARAGAVIQPGGGRAAQDLGADYQRAVKGLRPGDVAWKAL